MHAVQLSKPTYERLSQLAHETSQPPDTLAEQMLRALVAPGKITISEQMARRKVNHFIASELSVLAGAGKPIPVQRGGRSVWQVPVLLTQPGRGHLGEVGSILVDRFTGELVLSETTMEEMRTHARSLVASSPLPAGTPS